MNLVLELTKLLFWFLSLWWNLSLYIPKTIYNTIRYRMIGPSYGLLPNTVFLGGFGASPEDFPNTVYWGSVGDKIMWQPKTGTFSSNEDKATELVSSLLGLKHVTYFDNSGHDSSKKTCCNSSWLYNLSLFLMKAYNMGDMKDFGRPKSVSSTDKINFIVHSAGAGTIMQTIVYLHLHKIGLIKDKVHKGQKLTADEAKLIDLVKDVANDKYRILFKDDDDVPIDIGPDCINKIVFISPTAGGVDYVRSSTGMDGDDLSFSVFGFGWTSAWFVILLDRLMSFVPFRLFNLYLSQFSTLSAFPSGTDTGLQGFVEPVARQLTNDSMCICMLYNIKTLRVYTTSSVKIGGVYLPSPCTSPVLLLAIPFGCGWRNDAKYGEKYSQELLEHDGTISVFSQRYGHSCECNKLVTLTPNVKQCIVCKSLFTDCDHLSILGRNSTTAVAHERLLDWLNK